MARYKPCEVNELTIKEGYAWKNADRISMVVADRQAVDGLKNIDNWGGYQPPLHEVRMVQFDENKERLNND